MEKVYEYSIQFANEMDYGSCSQFSDRIEPNNNWNTIQTPLKSFEAAQAVLACLENNSIKFTRFWKIVRCEKETWREEVILRSSHLVIYESNCAIKHDNYVKSRYAKVEKINNMDKEFIIEEDFHGYKIFIERSEAIYKPDMHSDIKCHINVKFVSHNSNSRKIDFYLFNYLSENKKLLKKKFFENFINPQFTVVTKFETDSLLEKINNSVNEVNKILMS